MTAGALVDVVKGLAVVEPEEYTAGPELGAAAEEAGAGLNEGLGADEIIAGAAAGAGGGAE